MRPSIHGCTLHHHLSSLMHAWLLCYAYACNRCFGGSHASRIRASTSGGAVASSGAGGAGPRRRSRWRSSWVSRSPTFVFSERQALEHSKSPMFWKWLLWVSLFVDALSDRNWMQTLVAYMYLFLGQYKYPESYLGPGANQSLAMLRPVKVRWFPVTC